MSGKKVTLKFHFLLILLCLPIFAFSSTAKSKRITIISDGKSNYSIVLPIKPTTVEKSAAAELQQYLKKSTGVELSIKSESEIKRRSNNIFIGNTRFAQKHSLTKQEVGGENWVLKSVKNNLVITGGDVRGVLYGVWHFLEDEIGVRWWDPWEEDVPELTAVTIPRNYNKSGNPSFSYRDLYDSIFDEQGIDPKSEKSNYSLYQARNRLNGHFSFTPPEYGDRYKYGRPYHVHTFSRYFPVEVYFEKHPEWYAFSKEKNQRIDNGQLCLSNKELMETFKQMVNDTIKFSNWLADERGETRPDFFSISFNDVNGICECDECTAIIEKKGLSGYAFSFVNEIAEYIAPIYPDTKIETLAYWQYRMPPKDDTKPAKNVVIRLAEDEKDNMHSLSNINNAEILNRLNRWTSLCDNNNLYIWDYHLNYSNTTNSSMFRFEEDMHIFKEHNAQGIFGEIEWPLVADMWNMRVWMLAKLYENIDLKTEDLIDDFTRSYYGLAGENIKEFLYLIKAATDSLNTPMTFRTNLFSETFVTLDLALKCNNLFEEALEKVKDSEVHARRVRHARSYFDKMVVWRSRFWDKEAEKQGKTLAELGIDRKKIAQRIIDTLNEQGNFKMFDTKTKKEITAYNRVVSGQR